MPHFQNIDDLLGPLSDGATILCATQRLASSIRECWREYKLQSGEEAWKSPSVFAFDTWIANCWQEWLLVSSPAETEVLLRSEQELLLWEQVITASELGSKLLRADSAAHQAITAWHNLQLWEVDLRAPDVRSQFLADPDSSFFYQWQAEFQRLCRRRRLLTHGEAATKLCRAYLGNELVRRHSVLLCGFTLLAPLQNRLITAAFESFQSREPAPLEDVAILKTQLPMQADEIVAAARWARAILAADTTANIAVVVPELTTRRRQVERIFADEFAPAERLPSGVVSPRPFNLSGGYPLSETPLVRSALLALMLNFQYLDYKNLEALLRSPFIGCLEVESGTRHKLLHGLKHSGRETWSYSQLKQLVESCCGIEPVTEFLRVLLHFSGLDRRGSKAARGRALRPAEWANLFDWQLQQLRWPGLRSPNSEQYQQLIQWRTLLEKFADLNSSTAEIGLNRALLLLRRLANDTLFQAQSAKVPIQILGLLEVSGLQFSHLWLSGLNDACWPEMPEPNALIPQRLQALLQMPRASIDRELSFAQQQLAAMFDSAKLVIISYAGQIGAEPARPANIIAGLRAISPEDLPGGKAGTQRGFNSTEGAPVLELIDTSRAPSLIYGTLLEGGAKVMTDASRCPFRAFACHRLGIEEMPVRQDGVTSLERGNLVHWALYDLWSQLQNAETLRSLDCNELEALTRRISKNACGQLAAVRQELRGSRLLRLEESRLYEVLSALLKLERERKPFEVLACEQKYRLDLGTIQLSLRVDRIDRIEDGAIAVLDYKTGNVSPREWFGERPIVAQLPLYSLIQLEAAPSAVAYIKLRIDQCEFAGVAGDDSLIPGVPTPAQIQSCPVDDWRSLLSYWEASLKSVAAHFQSGLVTVDPLPSACNYCSLTGLCRINDKVEWHD